MTTQLPNELDFRDDESHPIARIYVYDQVVTFDGGGAYLGFVITRPLDSSQYSLARFSEKQRFLLESFFSDYGRTTWGTPRAGKMKIFISLHPDSSPAAFELLRRFEEESKLRGVELRVTLLS